MYWYIFILSICIIVILYINFKYTEGFYLENTNAAGAEGVAKGMVAEAANSLYQTYMAPGSGDIILNDRHKDTLSKIGAAVNPSNMQFRDISSEDKEKVRSIYSAAFHSHGFRSNTAEFIPNPRIDDVNSLLGDINFCKQHVIDSGHTNAFSNEKFNRICGICMTRGSILNDNTEFSYATSTSGTGVVVYPSDKSFSLREHTQANPSAHSAFCEELLVDSNLIETNVDINLITGLVINSNQYVATKEYLTNANFIHVEDLSNCRTGSGSKSTIDQTIECTTSNTTFINARVTYGHFNESCLKNADTGSNLSSTDMELTSCIGKQSCSITQNFPMGQRQWYLDATCKVQEDIIPDGRGLSKRSYTNFNSGSFTSILQSFNYYWASPLASHTDITKFTVYGVCSVQKDTQVMIEYCTYASFNLTLHKLLQYSHNSTGFTHETPVQNFTLYKGNNTIKLDVTSSISTGNGLYFIIKDLDGKTISTLDNSWIFTTGQTETFANPVALPDISRLVPAVNIPISDSFNTNSLSILKVAGNINPADFSTYLGQMPIHYYNSVTLPSETLYMFAVFVVETFSAKVGRQVQTQGASWANSSAMREDYGADSEYILPNIKLHLTVAGVEKEVVMHIQRNGINMQTNDPIRGIIQNNKLACYAFGTYVEYFPAGTTNIRMSIHGDERCGVLVGVFDAKGVTDSIASRTFLPSGYPKSFDGVWKTDPLEVYAVMGPSDNYFVTNTQAEAVCHKYGSRQASSKDLKEAWTQGAEWCASAWVSDVTETALYPITTLTQGGCGNGKTGIMDYNPGSAGVTCFGPKPTQATAAANGNTIRPFNLKKYYANDP
jgi:hypothetical protein